MPRPRMPDEIDGIPVVKTAVVHEWKREDQYFRIFQYPTYAVLEDVDRGWRHEYPSVTAAATALRAIVEYNSFPARQAA